MTTPLAASAIASSLTGSFTSDGRRGGAISLLTNLTGESIAPGGQSSMGFICTVCSAMMGSTLMTLPWAFQNAGLVASLLMTSLVGAVSYYTCYIILQWGAHASTDFNDLSDLCCHYLGNWSRHFANITSIAVCLGVCATYHVLMASSLQKAVVDIEDLVHTGEHMAIFCCGSGNSRYLVSSIIVGVCVLPLTCFQAIDRLMRIGSYGSLSLVYNTLFIIVSALAGWPGGSARNHHVKEQGTMKDYGVFFGTLGLSLFIHNMVLQMGRGHRSYRTQPSVVTRDVGIAYCLAVVLYTAVGAVPAIACELGSTQYVHTNDGVLPQNILLAYDSKSLGAIIGQISLTLQIMIVYPLIGIVLRQQFFSSVIGDSWPGRPRAVSFSCTLVILTTVISSVYPNPGSMVGYVGVYTAIVYMLGLPIFVHLKARKAANTASFFSTLGHCVVFVGMSLAFLLQFIFF